MPPTAPHAPAAYARYAFHDPTAGPDWRWQRAAALAAGDPHHGRFADDPLTLRAAVYRAGGAGDGDEMGDVVQAMVAYRAGGLRKRALEAYLLTSLPAGEIAARTGLSPAGVDTYAGLFFAVRGDDPFSRELHAAARLSGDPLVAAARRGGPRLVELRARYEAGDAVLDAWFADRFERADLMDALLGRDPRAYVRAVARLRAIEAGRPPGLLHRRG